MPVCLRLSCERLHANRCSGAGCAVPAEAVHVRPIGGQGARGSRVAGGTFSSGASSHVHMTRSRLLVAGLLFVSLASGASAQDLPAPQTQNIVRSIRVSGAKELSDADVAAAAAVRLGEPLPDSLTRLSES